MDGVIIPIVHQRMFDFSFLSVGGSQTLVLARSINVVPFRRFMLITRVHANALAAPANFDIDVSNVFPSERDQQRFAQAASITRNIASGTAAPSLLTDLASDLGPFLEVSITANQSGLGEVQVQAQLSIDLLVRKDA